MKDDELERLETFLHDQIPLTRAMGVRLESCDAGRLVLCAPLATNHNHLGTAFGGSLAALATLAGYTLLWREIADPRVHIVVRNSSIDYRLPVTGELRAVCHRPDDEPMQRFRETFARRGKARIKLRVAIEENGTACVDFRGTFVALQK